MKYVDFIREHFRDEDFIQDLAVFENWFSQSHKKSFELTTLRMTLHEAV